MPGNCIAGGKKLWREPLVQVKLGRKNHLRTTMEWLALALTGFLNFLTPMNFIGDQVIAQQIRQRVHHVEDLSVRVDNAPNYQLVQGKIQRVRLASRGLAFLPDFRLQQLQLETDPIDLDWHSLGPENRNLPGLRRALRAPLQGAVELVINETDLNHALATPAIQNRLQGQIDRRLPGDIPRLQLLRAEVDFLGDDRLAILLDLGQRLEPDSEPEKLAIAIETGIELENGDRLLLVEPVATLNGRKINANVLNSIIGSFSDNLSLKRLENRGLTARILRYQIMPDQFSFSVFGSIKPAAMAAVVDQE